ncbi:MAG: hypothetical protein KDD63_05575, partial [Bacteroidetes bacterium]|nr:hypothetical protein [Bacteroidota bacterium]
YEGYHQFRRIVKEDQNWYPLNNFVDKAVTSIVSKYSLDFHTEKTHLARLLDRVKKEKIDRPVSHTIDQILMGFAFITLGAALVGAGGGFLLFALGAIDAGLTLTSGIMKVSNALEFQKLDELSLIRSYLKTPYSASEGALDIALGFLGLIGFLKLVALARKGKLDKIYKNVAHSKNALNAPVNSKQVPVNASKSKAGPTLLEPASNSTSIPKVNHTGVSEVERGLNQSSRGLGSRESIPVNTSKFNPDPIPKDPPKELNDLEIVEKKLKDLMNRHSTAKKRQKAKWLERKKYGGVHSKNAEANKAHWDARDEAEKIKAEIKDLKNEKRILQRHDLKSINYRFRGIVMELKRAKEMGYIQTGSTNTPAIDGS